MLSPFAGVYYPLSTLPLWMRWIGRALPPSYVFEGMRAVVGGHAALWGSLAIGGGLAVFYLGLACWFFGRTYELVVRSGLIARYSAETVS